MTFLAFVLIATVETTLYIIHFNKSASRKDRDAKALAKWETGGLTVGVPMVLRTLEDDPDPDSDSVEGEVVLLEEKEVGDGDRLRRRGNVIKEERDGPS